MSNWREWFNDRSGPGVLAGVTPWGWLGLLSDNGFRVSPSYLARFASITWSSLSQCPSVGFEAMCYGRAIRAAAVPAPLFVLGHWRSGTTLLHDLLAVDD